MPLLNDDDVISKCDFVHVVDTKKNVFTVICLKIEHLIKETFSARGLFFWFGVVVDKYHHLNIHSDGLLDFHSNLMAHVWCNESTILCFFRN